MHENCDFVVPVDILTPLHMPHFLGPHDTTVYLDTQVLKLFKLEVLPMNCYKFFKTII